MTSVSNQRLAKRGTGALRKSQAGYLLITVVVSLFLFATIAAILSYDSATNANRSS